MALIPKLLATPSVAIDSPAIAGPMTRDRLNEVELRAIALTRSSRGTSSATNAWRSGISIEPTIAGHQGQGVDLPDLDDARQGQGEQDRCLEHRHDVDDDQRPSLVDAIREDAAERRDDHRWTEQECHDKPELERRSPELQDEPWQRHRLHPDADEAADLAEPVAPIVRVAHRGEPATDPRSRGIIGDAAPSGRRVGRAMVGTASRRRRGSSVIVIR